jgi:hypothetical protein
MILNSNICVNLKKRLIYRPYPAGIVLSLDFLGKAF